VNLSYRPEMEHHERIDFGPKGTDEDTDLIFVWTLHHPETPAVPGGRYTIFADEETILYDGPYPFRDMAVRRETPEDLDGTPFGWSPMFDLLGPQDVLNGITTTIISNEMGRGIGNLVSDDDADVSVEALSSSMNLIKKKRGSELAPLEWPATPREFFEMRLAVTQTMTELVGSNSVAMGTPNEALGNDSSGAKLALIEATAMRNNSGMEQSHVNLIRDVSLTLIHLYRDFGGDHERVAKIAGKSRNYLLKSFTAGDLDDIDLVKVDMGNPLMRTVGGKLTIAERAVELKLIREGEFDKFIHLLKEGTAEPLFEERQAEELRIRGENEALMEGHAGHRALISDPHWKEIPRHLALLDNPALREPSPENEAIQTAVLKAVQEHITQFIQMPPWMVVMRGGPDALAIWQQIAAATMPAVGAAGGTAPPQPGEKSQTPAPKSGDASNTLNPQSSTEGVAGMPSMPTNPATGEQADIAGGMVQ
jgi:hypothetical protein